ncbi:MAG: RNHCP domain-containing protein [bacterium]
MSLTFIKNKEDFICEHCGVEVKGSGYTNHCPKCLWSKHVDIYPGDRAAICGGMMKPIKVEMQKGEFIITHKCEKCGHEKRNRASLEDNLTTVL